MLDFSPLFRGERTVAELTAGLGRENLRDLTNEMVDAQRAAIADATDVDVTFVPVDPGADDPGAGGAEANQAWTLGHVVVHTTASSEESAALALTLARGVTVPMGDAGHSFHETPWELMHSADQCVHRLEESRRMRLAMLEAWPDAPDLGNVYTPIPPFGPLNAVGRFTLSLAHDQDHLGQLREIMRQARVARGA